MLGRYAYFPTNIEGAARFFHKTPIPALQCATLEALYLLNQRTIDLKKLTSASPPNCSVGFEFGIADGDAFIFLDKEELKKTEDVILQSVLKVLDFYLAIRYHTESADEKRKPLKFDYKIIRFTFFATDMELIAYHERGNQRIPLEDLARFIGDQINEELVKLQNAPLTLRKVIKSQLPFRP
jgi:hypothetical protein